MSDFIKFCKTQITPFIADDNEIDLYVAFGYYLKGDHRELSLKKGVFIRGVVGSGKTVMFKMAQRFPGKYFSFKFINSSDVVRHAEESGRIERFLFDEWCFDDLGAEQKANYYGKSVEIFKQIIEARYDKWKYTGLRTHFTTNLSNEEVLNRYGERAFDRLKEMCSLRKYPAKKSKRGKSDILQVNILDFVGEKLTPDKIKEKNSEIMNIMFSDLSEAFKKGVYSFPSIESVKYYDVLEYFKMLPSEPDNSIESKCDNLILGRISKNLNHENRQIIKCLKDAHGSSDRVLLKLETLRKRAYKELYLSFFLKNASEIYDTLEQAKDEAGI